MASPEDFGAVPISRNRPEDYGAVPVAKSTQEADLADKLAGSSTGRFLLGVADPILSTTARAASALGDKSGMETMARLDEMKKRGSEALGSGGFDIAGLAGNLMSPVSQAAVGLPAAATAVGRIAQGTGIGALLGGTTHAKEGESNWEQLKQMGLGGLFGMGLSGGIEGIKAASKYGSDAWNALFGSTESKTANMLNSVAGDKRQAIIDALRTSQSRVPGEQLTAGQAALPASSPEFSALQEVAAKMMPGKYQTAGIEGRNESARQALLAKHAGSPDKIAEMEALRTAATSPMRETALANANLSAQKAAELESRLSSQQNAVVNALQDKGRFQTIAAEQGNLASGGTSVAGNISPSAYPVAGQPRIPGRYTENAQRVPEAVAAASETAGIESARKAQAGLTKYQLDSLAAHGQYPLETKPLIDKLNASIADSAAPTITKKALTTIRDDIIERAQGKTTINANALYTVRKEIGNTISTFSKETANWDKRLTSKIEGSVQKAIDDAIETAGGSGWRDYLRKYVEKSAPIETMRSAQAMQKALTEPLGVSERPAAFARASMNPDNPITNAQTQVAIDAVTKSLSREALHSKLASEGRSSAADKIGREIPTIPGTGILSMKVSVPKAIVNYLHDRGTKATLELMASKMDDPKAIAALMDSVGKPTAMSKIVEAMMKAKNPAIAGAVYTGGH